MLDARPGSQDIQPARPSHDWLYYRIYVSSVIELEALLEHVVRPLILPLRRELPDLRWFFLRFTDAGGPHLRFRLSAELPWLSHIQQGLDERLTRAQATNAEPRCVRFGKFLYQPENQKFGERGGVRLAERIFQIGSQTALTCLGDRHRAMRVAYGATQMLLLLAGLPAAQRLGFLHQYSWYWSGGIDRRPQPLSSTVHRLPELTRRAERFIDHIKRVLSDPPTRQLLIDYQSAVWSELRSPERRGVPRSDYFLLFHHIHLMNNRMGVYQVPEAQIARLLWAAELTGIDPSGHLR